MTHAPAPVPVPSKDLNKVLSPLYLSFPIWRPGAPDPGKHFQQERVLPPRPAPLWAWRVLPGLLSLGWFPGPLWTPRTNLAKVANATCSHTIREKWGGHTGSASHPRRGLQLGKDGLGTVQVQRCRCRSSAPAPASRGLHWPNPHTGRTGKPGCSRLPHPHTAGWNRDPTCPWGPVPMAQAATDTLAALCPWGGPSLSPAPASRLLPHLELFGLSRLLTH